MLIGDPVGFDEFIKKALSIEMASFKIFFTAKCTLAKMALMCVIKVSMPSKPSSILEHTQKIQQYWSRQLVKRLTEFW